MKKKVKIMIDMELDYPYLKKDTKQLSKDFNNWLKSIFIDTDHISAIIPVLYTTAGKNLSSEDHIANGIMKYKIIVDNEIIENDRQDILD